MAAGGRCCAGKRHKPNLPYISSVILMLPHPICGLLNSREKFKVFKVFKALKMLKFL